MSARPENSGIGRLDDRDIVYSIDIVAGIGLQCDLIAEAEVLEAAEETVAMSGDCDIAGMAGESGACDSAGATIERQVVGAVKDRHFQLEPRNRENCHGWVDRHCQRFFVSLHSLDRP